MPRARPRCWCREYIGETENQNLHLSSRNLEGVELVAGNQVHPYHLLRYESAIFALPALEKLQDSLKATAPKASSTRKAGTSRGPQQRKHAEVA